MDVEREIRRAQNRLRITADQKFEAATARVYDMTTEQYLAKLQLESLQVVKEAYNSAGLAWGQLVRAFHDGMSDFAKAFQQGFGK